MTRNQIAAAAIVAMLVGRAGDTLGQSHSTKLKSDSTAIVATVERFHAALLRGDSASAVRLLSPDLTVLEGGEVENRAEYVAHHLAADIEFAKAIPAQRKVVLVAKQGDVAWTAATSIARGKMGEREINSRGAELIVLSRSGREWRIRAIHWSSSRRSAP